MEVWFFIPRYMLIFIAEIYQQSKTIEFGETLQVFGIIVTFDFQIDYSIWKSTTRLFINHTIVNSK